MKKFRFEVTASCEITIESDDKEEARTSLVDKGIMNILGEEDIIDIYISDGEELD